MKRIKYYLLFLTAFAALFAVRLPAEAAGGAWARNGNAYYNGSGQVISGAYAMGIDVSKNNGTIDWNAVKADGVEFAILRCGYGTDLVEQDDSSFAANAAGCEAVGIPYGVYLYSYADTEARAVSEAQHVLRLIAGRNLSYPVYLDLEDTSILNHTTAQQRVAIAKAFCDTIEAAGYEAAIYANLDWFQNQLPEEAFDQWGRWVAHHSSACGYTGSYQMWQATSQGSVAGITGNVDINFRISSDTQVKPTVKASASGKKKVKVTWKPKKKGGKCHIYYSRKKKGKYRELVRNAKKGAAKIGGLKSGKKYYIKIRISRTINGVEIYSKYSKICSVTVK